MFKIQHFEGSLFGAWDTFARFLSMWERQGTVLFYTYLGAYTAGMPRKVVWIENQNRQGFGCSACDWVFKPAGALVGESLDEMKQKYEAQRDKEFAVHVCVKHPKAARPRTE